jgi:hypothetical protein
VLEDWTWTWTGPRAEPGADEDPWAATLQSRLNGREGMGVAALRAGHGTVEDPLPEA